MTMAELMSGYYQAQEMSTMVSALSRVVAEDDPWAAEAYQWAAPATTSSGGMGLEEPAMRGGGGYVHELGSYPGAPSSEFAGNSQHTHAVVVACSNRALHALLLPLLCLHFILPHRASACSSFFFARLVFLRGTPSRNVARLGNMFQLT
jgi:hypothetical protein